MVRGGGWKKEGTVFVIAFILKNNGLDSQSFNALLGIPKMHQKVLYMQANRGIPTSNIKPTII